MNKIKAVQSAELSATPIANNLQRYCDLINSNIRPPVPVKPDDIYIRAMFIISDGVNAYGGKFDRVDMPEIARRFVDSPVLIGHDKGGLPIARNFWAETVEKDGGLWIKSYFYWLKQSENAERLALNIDAGIYKECSVSFIYDTPECSACGQDIRTCGHQVSRDIHFYYRGVEKILETSLVYRGAIPGTSITDQLAIDKPNSGVFRLIPAASGQFGLASEPNSKTVAARLGGRRFYLVMQE
jgi:hypothetical protein